MNLLLRSIPPALLIALIGTSCSEDPKLVEKREKQKAEIIQLKGELSFIEEKLKTMPPDVSEELAEAKKVAATQADEVTQLETEVATLEGKKAALQGEYDAYRAKYQVK